MSDIELVKVRKRIMVLAIVSSDLKFGILAALTSHLKLIYDDDF